MAAFHCFQLSTIQTSETFVNFNSILIGYAACCKGLIRACICNTLAFSVAASFNDKQYKLISKYMYRIIQVYVHYTTISNRKGKMVQCLGLCRNKLTVT